MPQTANPIRVYGLPSRPADPLELAAGPLHLRFENGEIRYIRLGQLELVRRVYLAVRDRNWSTIPGRLSDLKQEVTADTFRISFTMTYQAGEIDFRWQGTLIGESSGRIRFTADGAPTRPLLTNRTGFCVLHPVTTCVGAPCSVTHVDGSVTEASYPDAISPHQPFKDIRAITQSRDGARWRITMEGETFEMEDQRNWSDGSFKTYCRPLGLAYPYTIEPGQRLTHTITIDVLERPQEITHPSRGIPELDLTAVAKGEWVPEIGLGVAERFAELDERTLNGIASLRPRHLRVDLDLTGSAWQGELETLAPILRKLAIPLEVALKLPASPHAALRQLATHWPALSLQVKRWIILPERGVTTHELAQAARDTLAAVDDKAMFTGGTDAEFVSINRQHPPVEALDGISFALNPQVHASDNLSLMENLQSQSDILTSAVRISAGRPVAVTPITLKPRFNPVATAPDAASSPDTLPPNVDPRQMSLFAAAWTVGSLSHLCHADTLTYFQTHGWRGVLQGSFAPALPAQFPAEAGELFPVYHVLKSFLSFNPEHWSAPDVHEPLQLAAILLHKTGRQRLLLANLTPRPLRVPLLLPQPATLTRLDAAALTAASRDAEFWLNAPGSAIATRTTLELTDHAVAQIDWSLI